MSSKGQGGRFGEGETAVTQASKPLLDHFLAQETLPLRSGLQRGEMPCWPTGSRPRCVYPRWPTSDVVGGAVIPAYDERTSSPW